MSHTTLIIWPSMRFTVETLWESRFTRLRVSKGISYLFVFASESRATEIYCIQTFCGHLGRHLAKYAIVVDFYIIELFISQIISVILSILDNTQQYSSIIENHWNQIVIFYCISFPIEVHVILGSWSGDHIVNGNLYSHPVYGYTKFICSYKKGSNVYKPWLLFGSNCSN